MAIGRAGQAGVHRKVTVTVPEELLEFADEVAEERGESRSGVFAEALAALRVAERERLLAEGYRFYADVDRELAEEGLEATVEVWPDD
jgi:hypothetical protein